MSTENRAGNTLLDVRRAIERQVVDADEHAVFRDGEILLDEVRALLDREPVGIERVLRRVGGRAPVRHQLLLHGGAAVAGQAGVAKGETDHDEETAGCERGGHERGSSAPVLVRWRGVWRTCARSI